MTIGEQLGLSVKLELCIEKEGEDTYGESILPPSFKDYHIEESAYILRNANSEPIAIIAKKIKVRAKLLASFNSGIADLSLGKRFLLKIGFKERILKERIVILTNFVYEGDSMAMELEEV